MSNGKVIPAVNSRKSISGRYVRARFSYSATGENCLSFQEGDIILVNSRDSSGWWDGIVGGVRGRSLHDACVPR